MSSVNKATLLGNVCQAPEIRTMQSGDRVANIRLATNESWRDKTTGEKKEKAEYHNVVIFNQGIIGVVENHVTTGKKLYIEGQLETRSYEKDGHTKYTTEIVLRPYRGELVLLGDGRGNPDRQDMFSDAKQAAHSEQKQGEHTPEDFSDEIPFAPHVGCEGF